MSSTWVINEGSSQIPGRFLNFYDFGTPSAIPGKTRLNQFLAKLCCSQWNTTGEWQLEPQVTKFMETSLNAKTGIAAPQINLGINWRNSVL